MAFNFNSKICAGLYNVFENYESRRTPRHFWKDIVEDKPKIYSIIPAKLISQSPRRVIQVQIPLFLLLSQSYLFSNIAKICKNQIGDFLYPLEFSYECQDLLSANTIILNACKKTNANPHELLKFTNKSDNEKYYGKKGLLLNDKLNVLYELMDCFNIVYDTDEAYTHFSLEQKILYVNPSVMTGRTDIDKFITSQVIPFFSFTTTTMEVGENLLSTHEYPMMLDSANSGVSIRIENTEKLLKKLSYTREALTEIEKVSMSSNFTDIHNDINTINEAALNIG